MESDQDFNVVNNLNNIKKKVVKFNSSQFIIFSPFSEIMNKIENYIKDCAFRQNSFDPYKLACIVDLPGWLLIDLKNKLIHQDQIASMPCFFNKNTKTVYIGYPKNCQEHNSNDEYEMFGYYLTNTFGNLVLIGPGETYNFLFKKAHNWFEFKRTFKNEFNLDQFQNIIKSTFDNFSQILGGKEIIIPLSGGFDSRLILDELLKRKIELKVYTIGSNKNEDFLMARNLMNKLNMPIHEIAANRNNISDYLKTNDFRRFWDYAGGNFVVPIFAECLYSTELKYFKPNSIFAPGHSLDFLAGSHLPKVEVCTKSNSYKMVSDYHCLPKNSQEKSINIISKYIENNKNNLSQVELFDYKFRQSRYIVNHIRNYEFIGYKPVLPLFSFQLINFFKEIRLVDLINRHALLHKHKFSNNTLREISFVTAYEKKSSFKNFLKRFYILKAFVALIRYFRYSDKDTLYLSLGFKTIFFEIFFKGINHPLSLLRLIKKKIILK